MPPKYTFSDFYDLYKLAKARKRSEDDYYLFQCLQGEFLLRYFLYHKIDIKGLRILDLACGIGGYSEALSNAGAEVIGLDINAINVRNELSFIIANALKTPFMPHAFDLVICASLIEHVPNPRNLMNELIRLVNPKGFIYISFPPFYSINGGHQFSPFHYLGEKTSVSLTRWRERYIGKKWYMDLSYDNKTTYENAFGNWGLFPLTIKAMTELIDEYPVTLINRSTRWLPIDFSGIPYIGEVITWHVQFLFQKRE